MPRGYFITFEGLDGSGKTTQLQRLANWLTSSGHTVVTLRQPGSTALGDRLRAVLLDSVRDRARAAESICRNGPDVRRPRSRPLLKSSRQPSPQAPLFSAIASPILRRPTREPTRRLGSKRVLEMHAAVCDNLQPDLTLLLLPPLEASLVRARRRNHRSVQNEGTDENRFERESGDFYARVHAGYQQIAAREPQRVLTIGNDSSGDNSIDAIELRIRALVSARIPALRSS